MPSRPTTGKILDPAERDVLLHQSYRRVQQAHNILDLFSGVLRSLLVMIDQEKEKTEVLLQQLEEYMGMNVQDGRKKDHVPEKT
jgi:hypothetical protein